MTQTNGDLAKLNLKLGRETSDAALDPVPRELSRVQLSHVDAFHGFDLWNAYEVSFLLPSGKPAVYHMQATYDAHSPNIVESKSFKLFLNAQNNATFENLEAFEHHVSKALSRCVGSAVSLTFYEPETSPLPELLIGVRIDELEPGYVPKTYDPSVLEVTDTQGNGAWVSHLLRSNCPVTNQPDWGSVGIKLEKGFKPEANSLLRYLLSFRNHQGFHESCCEMIFDELYERCQPKQLTVSCFYTRRGGLDINPSRSTLLRPPVDRQPVWRQ